MDGVLKKCQTVDEAAIEALEAGCDLLILGGKLLSGERAGMELTLSDIERIHHAILESVTTGRLSEAQIEQSVARILAVKERYLERSALHSVDFEAHRAIAEKIASLALQERDNRPEELSPLREKNIAIFAPRLLQENMMKTTLCSIGRSRESCYFSVLTPSTAEIATAQEMADRADLLLIFSYNAWKNPGQSALVQMLLKSGKPTILVITRDPLDESILPEASLTFRTFSPTSPSLQAVCDRLRHR
jgi:beta-N-acetylhexosaminidase